MLSPIIAVHHDDSIYPNAHTFDGYRFTKLRELDGQGTKIHAATSSSEYLQFGHGQHAWYSPVPYPRLKFEFMRIGTDL
jgi:cytochrome P450